jgi:hypothetical protein
MALAHRGIAMKSDDKVLAILLVGFFMGLIGSMVVGWPAIVCAGIAICAIAMSKEKA